MKFTVLTAIGRKIMGALVLHMRVSLDGYVTDEDRGERWMAVPPDRGLEQAALDTLEEAGLGLIGHGVYSGMAAYWPTAEGETELQRAYIARLNRMPKRVVMSGHDELAWENTAPLHVTSDAELAAQVTDLKGHDDRIIVAWGGARLARSLARLGLIDEYRLVVYPIALGRGENLFADLSHWQHLHLRASRVFDNGTIMLRYQPVESR